MRKFFALVGVTGMAAASIAVAPAAQAKTVKACVKKSDGTVLFINKKNKKCKKGWVKATWNSTGPTGPLGPQGQVGPAGPNWTVKDKSGQTLGAFGGFFFAPLVPYVFVVLDDGGAVLYGTDGRIFADNSALFLNNGCTSAVLFANTNPGLQPYLQSAGGPGRSLFQVTNSPTVDAWKIAETTTTSVPVAANSLFQKSPTTGACSAATHAVGFIVPLTPAQAPKLANGGLRVIR